MCHYIFSTALVHIWCLKSVRDGFVFIPGQLLSYHLSFNIKVDIIEEYNTNPWRSDRYVYDLRRFEGSLYNSGIGCMGRLNADNALILKYLPFLKFSDECI